MTTEEIREAVILLILRASISFLSCCFVLFMIGIIFLFKKYKFFIQRLILYLAIAFFINYLVTAADVTAIFANNSSTAMRYCQFSGFAQLVSSLWSILSTLSLTIVMYIQVVPKRNVDKYELLFLLVTFMLPLTFSWIPFTTSNYGPVTYFCWISKTYDENCNRTINSALYRALFSYIPKVAIIITMIVLITIALVVVRKRKKHWHMNNSILLHKQLESEVRMLLILPIVIVITNLFGLLNVISNNYIEEKLESVSFVLLIFYTIGFRLQGVLITLVFTLDPDTRALINSNGIKAAFTELCTSKKDDLVQSYEANPVDASVYNLHTE